MSKTEADLVDSAYAALEFHWLGRSDIYISGRQETILLSPQLHPPPFFDFPLLLSGDVFSKLLSGDEDSLSRLAEQISPCALTATLFPMDRVCAKEYTGVQIVW